jgi:crotonobetainyl-CoA:carnitine CoA-transferase CaiB-like acyl-CoA transferase
VLAALDYRRRTGEGVHIDLSQYETGVQFIAPALIDFAANGKIAHRTGNRDPLAVVHGCYPCRNGQWCVISCWDDDELQRFRAVTGLHDLGDVAIGAWTRDQNAREVMHLLQRHRVHAACVNTMADLFSDPQLEARNIWQEMDHPEIGPQRYRMVAYQLSETPGRVRRGAPCLGEDNEEVLTRWLDLDEGVAPKRAATQRRT